MKIPKKIKIGGHTIQIIFKELEDDNGQFVSSKNIIYIENDLPQSQKEATFFHEVFHVLNSTLDSHNYGHALLDSLSEQFYQVLKDNDLLK